MDCQFVDNATWHRGNHMPSRVLPLTTRELLRYASRFHHSTPIVSYNVSCYQGEYLDSVCQRYTWGIFYQRCSQLYESLCNKWNIQYNKLGLEHIIGTLLSNSLNHLEIAYTITSAGWVFCPFNPKLDIESLSYCIRESQPKVIFYELAFQPLVLTLQKRMDATDICTEWICVDNTYECLIDLSTGTQVKWPYLDEDTTATLCFSSGITSRPRGVLQSHRDLVISSMTSITPDGIGLRASDVLLILPGFYHACSWNLIWMSALTGCKVVLVDDYAASESFLTILDEILEKEKVTVTAGVPVFWTYFLKYLQKHHYDSRYRSLDLQRIWISGATSNPLLISQYKQFHIDLIPSYGTTETHFCGCFASTKYEEKPVEEVDYFLDRIRPLFGINVKIDQENHEWNSQHNGELYIRCAWLPRRYHARKGTRNTSEWVLDGWDYFSTGDIGTITSQGYLVILEKKQNIVKLNGNWVSSLILENIALGHPDVIQASCVSVFDDILGDMCVIVIKKKEGSMIVETDIIKLYMERSYVPGYVVFIQEFPMTSNDKIDKEMLKQIVYNILHTLFEG
jgi:3-(methylthio)propionyl---CoA ligase